MAAKEKEKVEVEVEEIEVSEKERLEEANNFIRRRMFWAAGAGLIPIPLFDLMALTGLQIDMIRVLADDYGVPYKREAVKGIVSALVGSVVPVGLAAPVGSFLKAIPIVGTSLGVLSMSILGGASTYAVGKVFISHFEAGGTLLDFDVEAMNSYFMEKFTEGKQIVKDMKAKS